MKTAIQRGRTNLEGVTGRNLLVLVVEDDVELRDLWGTVLEQLGFAVVSAKNGVEGLRQFRRAQPDLVITDVRMPEMDGLTLVRKIRSDSELVPIVVVTGYKTPELDAMATDPRRLQVLRKPFTVGKFVLRLRALGLLEPGWA